MGIKRKKVILFWSGGKDSALSLFELKSPEWKIMGLLTTAVRAAGANLKAQTHELPMELIRAQAQSLELPLYEVVFDEAPSNVVYEQELAKKIEGLKKDGLEALAFGDLRLQDVRDYRDRICKNMGIESTYPLWGWKNDFALQAFAGLGHQAIVHCIDKAKIPPAFLGRAFNASFVEDLPRSVDSCGENGEFHTFVYDGPFFQQKLGIRVGSNYEKSGFVFQELFLNKGADSRDN